MKLKNRLLRYRQSFHLRVFLALVLVIVIFVPGTGYVGYLQALKVAEDQMEQYTIGTAEQISKRVTSFLTQHTYNVNLLASLFEKGLINSSDEAELLNYLQLFRKDHSEVVSIYFSDERGRFIMVPPQSPEVHKIFNSRQRPWYIGAVENQGTYWTDVYLFASTQKPGITVSAPIFDEKRQLRGVCGIDIGLFAFSKFLQGIDIGNQGVAYIFENRTGHLIAHPMLTELPEKSNRLDLLRTCRADLAAKKLNFGRSSYSGEQYFTAYSQYPGKDWTVGVTLSISDYLRKIQVIKKTTITLVIVAILLSSILSYLLAKTIISPLLRLRQGIERITRGDLSYRVIIKDPDIARDLARSFNRMALSLRNSLVQLKTTYAELQDKEKLAAVGKMTAGIAHEIKNPLGIILGSTQVVLDRKRPWEMREKAAGFIMDEVVRLDTTLKAFLDFAKPTTPVFVEVDIIRLLEETLSATEERYLEEGYRFVRDFPGRVPLLAADPAQLRQIFMNIFLNSFKAMPDGGTVTIRIRTEKEPEMVQDDNRVISIENPFTVARDWLSISISDDGCGIPETHMGKIMEPFISFRDDGIGLGLSIVSQLVKLHHGYIQIESSENEGTTFHLFFPCILAETGEQ
ncbi:MAG: cache domain-containing protein [Pseudomonadota bacterium]